MSPRQHGDLSLRTGKPRKDVPHSKRDDCDAATVTAQAELMGGLC